MWSQVYDCQGDQHPLVWVHMCHAAPPTLLAAAPPAFQVTVNLSNDVHLPERASDHRCPGSVMLVVMQTRGQFEKGKEQTCQLCFWRPSIEWCCVDLWIICSRGVTIAVWCGEAQPLLMIFKCSAELIHHTFCGMIHDCCHVWDRSCFIQIKQKYKKAKW